MTQPLPAGVASEVVKVKTRTFWVMEISFATPLRVCSRQDMTIGGDLYDHAGLTLNRDSQSVTLINENFTYTSTFRDQDTAGVRVRIWQGYGSGSFWSYDDLVIDVDGEMGPVSVGADINIALRREKPLEAPRLVVGDVISEAHLIPDGAVADTPSGKVKLSAT